MKYMKFDGLWQGNDYLMVVASYYSKLGHAPSRKHTRPGADLLETLPYEATLEMEASDFKDPDWVTHFKEFHTLSN